MKTDYPELEGKIVHVHSRDGITVTHCKVVGCNFHVGITLVNAEYTYIEKVCLNRKIHTVKSYWNKKVYKAVFYKYIKMIKDGDVYVTEIDELKRGMCPSFIGGGLGDLVCAFK